ncbi:hypothetical protein GCM10011369_03130 [Neiella marina]|uniref:GH16 domain-containing protein n=1 Tax=Neiella marina TaxID=508461 RepID=A0A8J2U225_9GAMM|nr:glycoside hydrolase family 16 protein [Neiella marina]GGA65082.1 hypothetical protein GCM10011369_03130 [Neiella marina]
MKTIHLLPLAVAVSVGLSGCGGSDNVTKKVDEPPMIEPGGWTLAWADEFDGNAIDMNNWEHEVNCSGGGNQERQCYTDDAANSYIENGVLKIVALPAEGLDGGKEYTSARLRTINKVDFTYGRVEIRAKVPTGQGSWPAAWMLPTDYVYGGWPTSGEIDIMETVNIGVPLADGGVESTIHGTLHYGKPWPGNENSGKSYLLPDGSTPADDFHTYAIEWEEGEIRWYVDGVHYVTQRQSEVEYNTSGDAVGLIHKGWFTEIDGEIVWDSRPFDQDFHILLNFAVGGSWPENVNQGGVDPTAFHADNAYEIDYVRVYKCETASLDGTGCGTLDFGYHFPVEEGGTLIEGAAPAPVPPSSGIPEDLTIFDEEANPNWPAWADAQSDPAIVDDEDGDYGKAVEFNIVGNQVAGFNTRIADESKPFDASPIKDVGALEFDLKIVRQPLAGPTNWYVKVEQNGGSQGGGTDGEVTITPPAELDTWVHYSIPLNSLSGLDHNGIDVVMLFPTWGQGQGAIYRMDNVEFTGADKVGDGNDPGGEFVMLDANGPAEGLTLNGYDGADNPDNNAIVDGVLQVRINGAGNAYLESADALDYTEYLTWDLVFDLKVNSLGTNEDVYVKFDSGWPAVSDIKLAETSTGLQDDGEWHTYTISVSELLDGTNRVNGSGQAIPTSILNPIVFEGVGGADLSIDVRDIRLFKEGSNGGDNGGSGGEPMVWLGATLADGFDLNGFNADAEDSWVITAEGILDVDFAGGGNVYFVAPEALDLSAQTSWYLTFDVKINNLGGASDLLVKIDSGWPNVSDMPLSETSTGLIDDGEWHSYSILLSDLLERRNSIDPSGIGNAASVINPFVMEGVGEDASFDVRNVVLTPTP